MKQVTLDAISVKKTQLNVLMFAFTERDFSAVLEDLQREGSDFIDSEHGTALRVVARVDPALTYSFALCVSVSGDPAICPIGN